jgi:hypothetical protein
MKAPATITRIVCSVFFFWVLFFITDVFDPRALLHADIPRFTLGAKAVMWAVPVGALYLAKRDTPLRWILYFGFFAGLPEFATWIDVQDYNYFLAHPDWPISSTGLMLNRMPAIAGILTVGACTLAAGFVWQQTVRRFRNN